MRRFFAKPLHTKDFVFIFAYKLKTRKDMKATTITQAERETATQFLALVEYKNPYIYYQGTIEQVAEWLRQPHWDKYNYPIESVIGFFIDYVVSQNMSEVQF